MTERHRRPVIWTNTMRATIKSIAELAGISKSTVDRALKNQPGVHPETREKVLRIAEECGYRKNTTAAALQRQNSLVHIAVVLRWRPFEKQMQEGMLAARDHLYDMGVRLRFFDMVRGDYREQCEILQRLKEEDIQGVIVKPADHPKVNSAINELEESGISVVSLSTDVPYSKRSHFIGPDYYQAGRIAGDLMYTMLRGTGNVIVFQESTLFQAFTERKRGFEAILRERNSKIAIKVIECVGEGHAKNYQLALDTFERHPNIDGVFCTGMSYILIAQAMLDCDMTNLRLIGYDIYEDTPTLFEQGAIDFVITQNPFREGYEAVNLLYHDQTNCGVMQGETYFSTSNIISRESMVGMQECNLNKI